jgi:hypothetical protein
VSSAIKTDDNQDMNRGKHQRIVTATGTFFGVLLIVLFAVAVTSKGALKGPEAFVLRWTVLSLAVAFGALVAWLRWKFLGRELPSKVDVPMRTANESSRPASISQSLPSGLGHHFGEGVYQFWITPEDLKARRFDKVELSADAY